jgi:hypothetical protein
MCTLVACFVLAMLGAADAHAATATFTATGDAFVNRASPTKKSGSAKDLDVLASATGERRSFIRFNVTGINGTVTQATLRAFPTTTPFAYNTRSVGGAWDEASLTWNNQPPIGSIIGSSSKGADGWTSADVTPLVSGNGQVDVALTTTSTQTVTLQSSETARPPQLVLNYVPPPPVTLTSPSNGSVTSDTTPVFSGAAGNAPEDSSTVTVAVYSGTSATGLPVQTLQATRSGTSWSVESLIGLGDGTYTAQAAQSNSFGSVGKSGTSTFRVDTVAPAPTLTQPADGSSSGDATPTFSGAAGTAAGDSTTVTVRVYSGTSATGTPVQTRQATRSGGSWSVDASPALADGTYTAVAEQSDSVGNTGTSSARTFRVDTTAPSVTLTQPADGSVASNTTPTFSGAAGTAPGDSDTVTVKVYSGTSATGTPVQTRQATQSGGSWSVDAAPALADGTYTAQAEQSDSAGSTGTSAARTFRVDTTAPSVTLTQPADGSTSGDATPTFSGSAGSAPGDSSTVTVRVYSGTSATGTPVQTRQATQSGGSWSVDASPALADGTYTAVAEQSDSVGNTVTSSASTFRVDTVAPAPTLTQPTDGSTTADATPTFSGSAGTDPGDSSTVTVKVYSGTSATGTPVQTRQATRSGGSWSVDASPALADGTYTAQAEQSDSAGNTGTSAARTFTIKASAPTVTLTQPADGSVTSNTTPTFSGAAGNAPGDSSTVTVKVYSGTSATGTPVQTLQATRSGGSWSVDASPALAEGTYTAVAEQADSAGNTGTSASRTFRVDTTAPSVTLTQPADGSNIGDATPTFSGSAGTDPGDSSTVTVRVYSGTSATGTPVQTLQATRSGGSWSVDASPALADGTYTAQAEQSDSAGNTGTTAARTFTIKASAPTVTLTQPADGSVTSDTTPVFSGAAGNAPGDSSTVTVKVYSGTSATGLPVQTVDATRSGTSWSVESLIGLGDGTYTAQAEQSDSVGSTGTSSPSTFRVDTVAPAPTLTQPTDGSTTADPTPTFSGAAGTAPGDSSTVTVRVYSGTSATGTPVQTRQAIRSGGSWSVDASPALADGTYTAQAEQADSAGNTGTTAARTFRADTTGPSVTLTQPANGSASSSATPTFSGAAGTAPGDSSTVTVRVYSGTSATGTPVQTLQATQFGGSWSVDASAALAGGTYTARAEQADSAGNTGTSAANTFTVNVSTPSGYRAEVMSDAPRAYWRLGETSGVLAADETANSNTGVYTNGPLLGQPGAITGDSDGSVYFNGVNNYVSVPAASTLDATSGVSVEVWVKRTKSAAYQVIVGKPGAGQSRFESYALWLNTADQLVGYFGNGTGYASVSSAPIDTNWHHVVTTYDNQTAKMYVDGTLRASQNSSVQLTPNSQALNIGRSGADNSYYFGGQLDEVAVYGTALSATRVQAHFTPSTGGPDTTPPDLTLTSPANGTSTFDTTPTFSGAAGSAVGDSDTVTVKVYSGSVAGGTPVQTLPTARSDGSWTVDASPALATGTYTARAEQGDTAGNVGFSGPSTFTIATQPPPTPSAYRTEVLSDSPRAYWRLGEQGGTNAADETTNTNIGTYVNGTQLAVPGALGGDSDTAVSFDGTNDYVTAPSSTSLNLTAGATVEAWVKRTKAASWQVVVGKPGNGQTKFENYALWFNPSDQLVAYFGDGTNYTGVGSTGAIDASWHYVVATYDNATVKLYVDGVLNNSSSSNIRLTANTQPLNMGRANDNSLFFGGQLDEVALYNTALSVARVQSHYAVGRGPDTTPPDVTLTTPEGGSQTIDTTPAFAGMAAQTGSDSTTVTVRVYSGSSAAGTPVQTLTTTRKSRGSWDVTASASLPLGTYTAVAEQSDTAGNVGRATNTFSIVPRPAVGSDPVLVGAGDIADCDGTGDEATAALLDLFPSATVFTLGDNVYEFGTTQEFNDCYNPSWGRAKTRTRPALGDHDYGDGRDPQATGYFGYFSTQLAPFGASATDPIRGYYSYDVGSWHVVVLNTSCGLESAPACVIANQISWLRSDLAAHPNSCALAVIHAPRWSSGSVHGSNASMQVYWQELVQGGVELALSGDDHDYERFAPQNANGEPSPNGLRQMIVGTGGRSHYLFSDGGIVKASSEVREDSTYGILRLVLRSGGYEWEFVPQAGRTFIDSGSDTCH